MREQSSVPTSHFVLQFSPSEIHELAIRYRPDDDLEAFSAGSNIAGGDYSRANLKTIIRWKSPRRIAYLDHNTDVEIARSLRFASDPRTSEKSGIETLCKLHGVGVPTASAILTTIIPEKYTIIDFRALESLGVAKWPNDSVEYYIGYLQKCRELASANGVSLRTLDRALWRWSKENGRGDKGCFSPF